jgi:osmotically-inducible protein OsmY
MKTDIQLKSDVTEQLEWEPTVSSVHIDVDAKDGIITLRGTVPNYAEKGAAERATQRVEGVKAIAEELTVELHASSTRKDPEIAQAVINTLRWHEWVPDNIQATVENGWVTLSGSARWDYERRAAEDCVRFLSGVTGVSDNIILSPGIKPKAIKAAIEKALGRDAEIDAANIDVSADGGKVTLAGTVGSWGEREEAAATAWSAPGVEEVENELAVSV